MDLMSGENRISHHRKVYERRAKKVKFYSG